MCRRPWRRCRSIGVIPGKIITARLDGVTAPVRDGLCHADVASDVLKVCVLERHGRNGNVGRGFVRGFGLTGGALASSVGHDSHNVCVVGADDADMALAVNRLIALGGGFVAVRDGRVLAELALPIAGLMSAEPFETVRDGAARIARRGAGDGLPARGAVPATRLPVPAGDPASEDHGYGDWWMWTGSNWSRHRHVGRRHGLAHGAAQGQPMGNARMRAAGQSSGGPVLAGQGGGEAGAAFAFGNGSKAGGESHRSFGPRLRRGRFLRAAPRRRCRRNGPNRAGAGAGDCGAGAAPAAGRSPACGRAGGGCARPAALARAAPPARGRPAGSPSACGRYSCPSAGARRSSQPDALGSRSAAGDAGVRPRGFSRCPARRAEPAGLNGGGQRREPGGRRRSRTQASRVSEAVAPCLGPLAATAWHSHSITAAEAVGEARCGERGGHGQKQNTTGARCQAEFFARATGRRPRGPARRGAREAGGKITPCRRLIALGQALLDAVRIGFRPDRGRASPGSSMARSAARTTLRAGDAGRERDGRHHAGSGMHRVRQAGGTAALHRHLPGPDRGFRLRRRIQVGGGDGRSCCKNRAGRSSGWRTSLRGRRPEMASGSAPSAPCRSRPAGFSPPAIAQRPGLSPKQRRRPLPRMNRSGRTPPERDIALGVRVCGAHAA